MHETSILLFHPLVQPVWIMLSVMLVERLINWPDKYHPLSFFRIVASGMDKKVRPDSNDSVLQQKISGSLAAIVLLVPFLVILAILINLAEYPQFFDALLLLCALQFRPYLTRYKKIMIALKSEKKVLARSILSTMVLRNTDKLSPLGIAKAAIEGLLLRAANQYVGTLFWYLIFGGLGAITYRILFEFAQAWNTKMPNYRHFGQPVRSVFNLLAWLPSRIFVICLATAENISGAIKAMRNRPRLAKSNGKFLSVCGGALGVQLSGPAYYAGQKVRAPRVGGPREVRFADMPRALNALMKTSAVMMVLMLFVMATSYALTQGMV